MKTRGLSWGWTEWRPILFALLLGAGLATAAAAETRTAPGGSREGGRGASATARSATRVPPSGPSEAAVTHRSSSRGGGDTVSSSRPRGDSRHYRDSRYRRPGYRPHPRPGVRFSYSAYWPLWHYGVYLGWPYFNYWNDWFLYPTGVQQAQALGLGALDLDVSPERAHVYLDGQYLGVCDDYDGFPDYLWLEPGTYDLVFYLDGYRTVAHQVTVRSGVKLDFNDRMVPGESVRPEDLPSKSVERREERLRRDREAATAAGAVQGEREEAWRTRRESGYEPGAEPATPSEVLDARGEPGRLQLRVVPPDASVYLDGRFLGTGEDLARLHSSLLVDAGRHRLEIVRPGYESLRKEFTAAPGEEVVLDLQLEEE